jgi:hypothetical protein
MNPYDPVQLERLSKAMETSYRELAPFRNLTRELVEEYAGSGYGRPSRPRYEIMINLMNQTVDAYTMALVANRPRVLLSTQMPELTYFAKQFQVALNNMIEEIGLEFTLRQWVLDAFFCIGIVKVHMADSGLVQLQDDLWMDPGKPFASNVGIDNWVHDQSATRWDQVKYAGDSYRIPFEDLKHPMYDPAVVEKLVPNSKRALEEMRVERISRGETVDQDELEPMIDLCDVWIPRDGKIYTFPLDNRGQFRIRSESPVAVMDWDGPELGPYHMLGFNDVPENIMPTSPASHLGSLARLANNLMRKQSKQAKRQKQINTFSASGTDDAKQLQSANDGDFVKVLDPKEIGQINMGGVDGHNQAFLLGVVELYDRFAGNLTAMMGLGSQAPTASQEQIIQGRVSNKEASMQYRVIDATSRLVRDLGWLMWNDKAKTIPGRLPVEGAAGYSVDATWTPHDREGTFFDYRMNIDVFSMAYQSPGQRVQAINNLITQIYAPMGQLLMQQGGQLNLQKLVELHADLLNLPQLREAIQFVNILPGEGADAQDAQPPASPPTTTRNYTRTNIPSGGTVQSRNHIAQQSWLNGAVNSQQQQSMMRPAA